MGTVGIPMGCVARTDVVRASSRAIWPRVAADYFNEERVGGAIDMDVFIARRPIFDKLNRVYAYKLVHSTMSEGDPENLFDSALQLIDNSLLVFDLDTLSAGKKLFFTFTDEAIEMGCAELL